MSTASDILFGDFAKIWFGLKKSHRLTPLSTKTLEDYRSLYHNHVEGVFETIPMRDISGLMLDTYFSSLRLATSTINKIKTCIVLPILRKAYANGLIPINPTVGLEPITVKNVHHKPYTPEEVARLAEVSQGSYWHIAIPLLINTGIRRAELLGLKWEDYDPKEHVLHIKRDYVSTNHECQLKDTTKTESSTRLVAIPAELCDALNGYRRKKGVGKTFIISQQKADKPVDPHNFSRTFRKWCEAAGIPKDKRGGHSTRATYCTMASQSGCDLDGLRRQVGHQDFRMLTKVYMRDTINQKQYAVADKMGTVWKNAVSSMKNKAA